MTICYGMGMRRFALAILLLPIAACTQTIEDGIASRLAAAGLPRPMADCMAERWASRLNASQLRKISGLAGDLQRERGQGQLTVGRFVGRVAAMEDPEIVSVVSTSAAVCALSA